MKEDSYNYLTLLRTDDNGCIRYTVATCAERENGGFKNAGNWFDYLTQWRDELSTPCVIEER